MATVEEFTNRLGVRPWDKNLILSLYFEDRDTVCEILRSLEDYKFAVKLLAYSEKLNAVQRVFKKLKEIQENAQQVIKKENYSDELSGLANDYQDILFTYLNMVASLIDRSRSIKKSLGVECVPIKKMKELESSHMHLWDFMKEFRNSEQHATSQKLSPCIERDFNSQETFVFFGIKKDKIFDKVLLKKAVIFEGNSIYISDIVGLYHFSIYNYNSYFYNAAFTSFLPVIEELNTYFQEISIQELVQHKAILQSVKASTDEIERKIIEEEHSTSMSLLKDINRGELVITLVKAGEE